MAELVEFELMRPPQIAEARRRCPVVYVPFGPLEWHGPAMPMGTDAMAAHRVAVEVAKRVGGVVLPAYHLGSETVRVPDGPQGLRPLGFEGHERVVGMDFPDVPRQEPLHRGRDVRRRRARDRPAAEAGQPGG